MNAPEIDPLLPTQPAHPDQPAAESAEAEAKPKRRRAPRKVVAATEGETPAPAPAVDQAPSWEAVFAPAAPQVTAREPEPVYEPPGAVAAPVAKAQSGAGADTSGSVDLGAEPSAEPTAALATQAQWLMRYPAKTATIEGHCDERGTREYNLALGERRANAAKTYLASLGVDASRLNTVSYGKERPAAMGSDEASWAKNRRAVTVTID